ncbi:MAG: ROK family protein [Nocardioidaceae bacterium]
MPPSLGDQGAPARPQLMRVVNEQLVLTHLRSGGAASRADLARISGLSKPTVSLALANLGLTGLVRTSGVRTGVPGPAAMLYEVDPDAGYVMALDLGHRFVRGAVMDITGSIRAKISLRAKATSGQGHVAELEELSRTLLGQAGLKRDAISQTILGTPGVYSRDSDSLTLAGLLTGWDTPVVLTTLRQSFGESLVIENDVDAAALAEQAYGHGQNADSFAFFSVGTGIGMGLVINGRLHRGAHGVAGEVGFLPIDNGAGSDPKDARQRGTFEAAASAAGIVRAARRAGLRGPVSAQHVFAAADRGDERALEVVAKEADLVAKAICSVITVADPDLVVLGGGIGRAVGFGEAVGQRLKEMAPVMPDMRVSALGDDAVLDGCLSAGLEQVWRQLTRQAR